MPAKLPTDPAVTLTDSLVERLAFAAKTRKLQMQSGGRRWYRDTGCPGLQLMLTQAGGSYYRVSYEGGKRTRHCIGGVGELSLKQARKACADLSAGSGRRIRKRATAGEPTVGEVFAAMQEAARTGQWFPGQAPPRTITQENQVNLWRPHVERAGHSGKTLTAFATAATGIHAGLSDRPSVANLFRVTIRSLYRFAAVKGWWSGGSPLIDPRTGEQSIRRMPSSKRTRFLSPQQVALMADHMESQPHPWRIYWLLAVLVGCRMSNLISARWADVDLSAGLWTFQKTKTDATTVATQPEAVALLEELRASNPKGCQWLFPSPDNPAEHRRQWRDSWERCKAAVPELADTRPHDLRRTCGSLLTIAGVPLPVVGKQLGHAPGSSATAVYARLDLAAQRAGAAKLGGVLGDAIKPRRTRR